MAPIIQESLDYDNPAPLRAARLPRGVRRIDRIYRIYRIGKTDGPSSWYYLALGRLTIA
jgi:hypothetical protein